MTIVSVLLNTEGPQQLVKGVFGRFDGEKFHIDPLLQRIYLFSLQKELPANESGVLGLEVPTSHRNTTKANLITIIQRHWNLLYESRAPLAGALQGMVRAEQAQVNNHCQSIIQDLQVGDPTETHITVGAHIPRPEHIGRDSGDWYDNGGGETLEAIVTVNAIQAQRYVNTASINEIPVQSPDGINGLEAVDMDAEQPYDMRMSLSLMLYGNEEQRKLFVEMALPAMMQSGMLETVPTRVLDYQQSDRNEEAQRFGPA